MSEECKKLFDEAAREMQGILEHIVPAGICDSNLSQWLKPVEEKLALVHTKQERSFV